MRAAVLEAPDTPLRVERIPMPEPAAGEVLVRVTACGVCHTDLHVLRGEVAFPTPAVLGHEVSGTVAALGAGVAGPPVGTDVACAFLMPCGTCPACARGRDDLCERFFALNRQRGLLYDGTTRLRRADGTPLAMYSMGGLAEYAVVPATAVFPLPAALPRVESSVVGCALLTAYGAVRHAADLWPGARVAVVAVGGVGSSIVQVARAFGARQVVAVDVRDEALAAALALGATHAVNAAREDAVDRVRTLAGGTGVDVAFEALGRPETFTQALAMLRDGGRLVAVGIAAGDAAARVPITHLVRRGLQVTGSYGARTRTDMPEVLALAEAGVLRPERAVSRRFPLEAADEAYRLLAGGGIVGRAVITP